MSNFKKIECKRKGLVHFVHEGFIHTKNNADSLKTRLRCHRWRDGCECTAFIQDNHFHLNIKCQHEPEMSEGDLTCQQMENVSIIHADGTFKIVPKNFYQLLIIHCVFSDFLIPVFYAVMTSKSRLLYDALFLSIRNFLLRKFNARHPNFWVFINCSLNCCDKLIK